MKVPEHVACSFLLAQLGVQQQYGWPGTALVIAAGCLPDLDGVGIFLGWRFYRRYHRILGHGLPMNVLGPLALAFIGYSIFHVSQFFVLWPWLQLSLFLHLFTDVCFYNWPVQLAWPLSQRGCAGGLLTWNDLVPTLLLYSGSACAIVWQEKRIWIASVSLLATSCYLGWRVFRPARESAWEAWLAGGWTARSPRFCRWLTGDFVT